MTQLKITGMTCDSCAVHVREALEGVPGVREARVSYPDATAQIALEREVPLDRLVQAVVIAVTVRCLSRAIRRC
ncbi:mercuric ion reductase [mine drainage metagenome]|uniref:Mercuric ion reductase n=1 Tax=mine drainage metagenome TaxID=410659 RepID=T1BV31_9ZZZZ